MTRKSIMKPMLLAALLTTSTVGLSGCGYNNLQAQDEQVTASWSEVVNQYQRRSDLVPNLVKVVQQYAEQEQEVFTQVAEARSRAGGITVTPEVLNDPEAMERYAAAQEQMTGALSRLMAVSERYPDLKSDVLFQDLQAQLEGTENRIAVRYAYEWRDDSDNWFRSYGNENWEFAEDGLMRNRFASINDLPITKAERKFLWPQGRRPDDHPGLSELGL